MSFWDSSALIALVLPEPGTTRVARLLPSPIAFWWATPIECDGALARANRSGRIPSFRLRKSQAMLEFLFGHADEVPPWDGVRDEARRLVNAHSIRAADSIQLAGAREWCGGNTRGESFVCLDDRLRAAAALEGFRVLPYSEEVNEARVEYGAL